MNKSRNYRPTHLGIPSGDNPSNYITWLKYVHIAVKEEKNKITLEEKSKVITNRIEEQIKRFNDRPKDFFRRLFPRSSKGKMESMLDPATKLDTSDPNKIKSIIKNFWEKIFTSSVKEHKIPDKFKDEVSHDIIKEPYYNEITKEELVKRSKELNATQAQELQEFQQKYG